MAFELVLVVLVPIALIIIAKVVGARAERAHYASLAEREAHFRDRPALSSKHLAAPVRSTVLASASVVVSVDHFKRFVGGFKMLS
jgi:hypothetical protein